MGKKINGFISETALKYIAFTLAAIGKIMVEAGQPAYLAAVAAGETAPASDAFLALGGEFLFFFSLPMVCMVLSRFVSSGEELWKKTILFGIAAVLYETAYDLLAGGTDVFNGSIALSENVYLRNTCIPFSLFISFLGILFIERFVKKKFENNSSVGFILLSLFAILAAGFLSMAVGSELGVVGVLFMAYIYLFADSPVFLIIAVAATLIMTLGFADPLVIYGPIAGTVVLWFCTGEKKGNERAADLYVLLGYPVLTLVFGLIINL